MFGRAERAQVDLETGEFVSVEGVRTNVVRGKTKRVGRSIGKRPNFKKAVVTLKEGDKIELFEGGAV